ncbi:MAG: 4'-phosphopantetheinyl transferase superfamily protein [Cyanobacteria bacterium P01_D01_bin.2]
MGQNVNPAACLGKGAWVPATADVYSTLGPTTLDLWRIPLAQEMSVSVLSEDELVRFNRYRFAADRRKFAVARSRLRQILAHYCQQAPAALVFDYGDHGKPFLRGDHGLQFNLSHSGEYGLCGVARRGVGVDIELLRPMDRLDGLMQRCLTPTEQQALVHARPMDQSEAFLTYWTCKEAYLKATGQGISAALSTIEVRLTPYPQLLGQPWQLQVFTPCDRYTAAVVMSPEVDQIRLLDLGPS